ncbi:universal stress protein [Solwaraspora sp. WMMD406]|uniref:universal stress protein n=1 Tax=Solwaraspora sp. WMMD406 TaxID=3016095 RepID=UPI0024166FE7|nr:universal stress protein [Solwaraspora sp. WMMD406]MDG4765320.1 universal stress protein [Solwaraspora sp. WMMD406]
MSTVGYVAIVVVLWVLSGITAAAVFLTRRGQRAWYWYVLGAVLGLLFVPIALERGSRPTGRVESRTADEPVARHPGTGPRVLVGLDGSAVSDRALSAVEHGLAGDPEELILVTVVDVAQVDPGNRTGDESEQVEQARRLLADRADQVRAATPGRGPATTTIEIVTGQPARALLDVARTRAADLIVIGRRGSGVSNRLMGSVADQVVRESTRSVLVAGDDAKDA